MEIKEESKELKLMHVEQHLQFDSADLAEILTPGGRLKQPFRSLISHYSTLMRPQNVCKKRMCTLKLR